MKSIKTVVMILAILAITVSASAEQGELELFEVTTPIKFGSSDRASDSCLLFKHNPDDTILGYSSSQQAGYRTVAYLDPASCSPAAYPFEISSVSFPLFAWDGWQWPVEVDLIIYAPSAIADPCNKPDSELVRISIICDSADFHYPNVGEVILPSALCLDGPFYVGIEYTDNGSGPFPSVMFDIEQSLDSCDQWQYFSGTWWSWDEWWPGTPKPGNAFFWVNGMTQSTSCCVDSDGDLVCDLFDNCPSIMNNDQLDTDSDGFGDLCDNCVNDAHNDFDSDGFCADVDNCPSLANPLQEDVDLNGIGDLCESCCVGMTGNINYAVGEMADISDLTFLVDFMFRAGPALPCPAEADLDGSGMENISDLTYLVDYLFRSGPPPAPCL